MAEGLLIREPITDYGEFRAYLRREEAAMLTMGSFEPSPPRAFEKSKLRELA